MSFCCSKYASEAAWIIISSITDGDLAVGAGPTVLVARRHEFYSCVSVHLPGSFNLVFHWFIYLFLLVCFFVCFKHRQTLESHLLSQIWHWASVAQAAWKRRRKKRRRREVVGQYNGWPEQYITLLQICFIRIHKKHHDHTLTWESCTYMPVKMRGFLFFLSFLFWSQILANCYNILLWKKYTTEWAS